MVMPAKSPGPADGPSVPPLSVPPSVPPSSVLPSPAVPVMVNSTVSGVPAVPWPPDSEKEVTVSVWSPAGRVPPLNVPSSSAKSE